MCQTPVIRQALLFTVCSDITIIQRHPFAMQIRNEKRMNMSSEQTPNILDTPNSIDQAGDATMKTTNESFVQVNLIQVSLLLTFIFLNIHGMLFQSVKLYSIVFKSIFIRLYHLCRLAPVSIVKYNNKKKHHFTNWN